uniref:hypothetical protein n=1 Tax=Burkholderia anthina TaxID=179879 RepID=UPI001588BB76|nr:hypothetical protein [Burkholderia anthina]
MSDRKMRIPAFSDKIPDSTLGAWLALFVVFCSSCRTVIGVLIYVVHHPDRRRLHRVGIVYYHRLFLDRLLAPPAPARPRAGEQHATPRFA